MDLWDLLTWGIIIATGLYAYSAGYSFGVTGKVFGFMILWRLIKWGFSWVEMPNDSVSIQNKEKADQKFWKELGL